MLSIRDVSTDVRFFFRNGVLQGDAFHGVWEGHHYPAVSCYYGGSCTARFSAPFKHFPEGRGGVELPEGVDKVRPWGDAVSEPTPFLDHGAKVRVSRFFLPPLTPFLDYGAKVHVSVSHLFLQIRVD